MQPLDRNYRLHEAAQRIGISKRTVERYVAAGIIRRTSRRGRTQFVAREDVEFLATGGSPDELLARHAKAG